MSVGTVTIQVSPQVAEALRILGTQAESQQLSFDVYLDKLVKANDIPPSPASTLTPEEKVKLLNEWVASNARRVTHFVDDSRESIYREREDQQL